MNLKQEGCVRSTQQPPRTWEQSQHLLEVRGKLRNVVSRWQVARPSGCLVTSSQQFSKKNPSEVNLNSIVFKNPVPTAQITCLHFERVVKFEEYHLLGYKAVKSVKCQPTFRRNILPPSSESKKQDEQETGMKAGCICLPPTFTPVFCSALFFDPEDGKDMFLRNVG
jgi:hypothetical protein